MSLQVPRGAKYILFLMERRRKLRKQILLQLPNIMSGVEEMIRLMKEKKTLNRRFRQLERQSSFWEAEVPLYDENKFKEDFRMSRENFNDLVQRVIEMKCSDTVMRKSISLHKRVAIALYALGSSAEYRTIANLFGVGRTTVVEIVREFCDCVCKNMDTCIQGYPPTEQSIKEVTEGFALLGFPQCYGAIDGCHIEVNVPVAEAVDYHNFKGWNSIVLFASCDHRSMFTYVNVGATGRNSDSFLFENSYLKKAHMRDPVFSTQTKVIENTAVPVVLIGDSAFRLSEFVLKPFPFSAALTEREKAYNYMLSKCRRVVENAFVQLKARFQRLGKGLELKVGNASNMIKACCILHNYLAQSRDGVSPVWMEEMQRSHQHSQPATISSQVTPSGVAIRNAIADEIYGRRPADEDDIEEAREGEASF